jgi:hypothetical protein
MDTPWTRRAPLRGLAVGACFALLTGCFQVITRPAEPADPTLLLDDDAATEAPAAAPPPAQDAEQPGPDVPQPARAAAPPPQACQDVAASFFAVATYRDEGLNQEQQIALARERVGVRDSERAFRHWLRIIEIVYRLEDRTPKQIAATVLEGCSLNEHGQAVVKTPWPREQ